MRAGRIEVIAGPMFSGKTSELLRRLRRLRIGGMRCCLIKHARDMRYAAGLVSTHDSHHESPTMVMSSLAVADIRDYDAICIDEAGFFEDIASVATQWADAGKIVIVATIDTDFQRQPFRDVPSLLAMAERVDKLTAICSSCNLDASFTARTTNDQGQLVVGGAEAYRPLCRACHLLYSRDVEALSPVPAPSDLPLPDFFTIGFASEAGVRRTETKDRLTT